LSNYVFDLERSARGLRLNRFLHGLTQASNRKLLLENPDEAMKEAIEAQASCASFQIKDVFHLFEKRGQDPFPEKGS